MNKYCFILLLILIGATSFSCKSTKPTTTKPAGNHVEMLNLKFGKKLINNILSHQTGVHNMSCKIYVEVTGIEGINNFRGNLVYVNPKEFKVDVALLGIPLFTAFIHNDSIFGLNRLQKMYFAESIDNYGKKYHLNISGQTVEDVLLGRILSELYDNVNTIDTVGGNYILGLNNSNISYSISTSYNKNYINGSYIHDNTGGQQLNITYPDDRRPRNTIPEHISFTLNNPEIRGKINFSDITINDETININFIIPENYQLIMR